MGVTTITRRVTWRLSVSPEVLTEYAGTRLRAYYTDPEVMFRTQERARERFLELFGVEVTRPHVAVPAYIGAAALGAHIYFPDDDSPMLADQGRVLTDDEAVAGLTPADPAADPNVERMLEVRAVLEARSGGRVPLSAGQEGPVTTAMLLRGQQFLEDLYRAPELARHLLEVVTDTYLAYVRHVSALNGGGGGTVGIADDFAGLISPAMWPEFVVPYWERIFTELGPGRRVVHSELLHVEHLAFLEPLRVDHFDPGADQYLTGPLIRQHTSIPFTRYLLPVDDLLLITPEGVRRRYQEEVEGGASHIDADVSCRGIPAENIRAFIAIAREYESFQETDDDH
ncbi:MAG: uroporphyrinogen decarboxylase family protein [Anaerolineae bacterium]